MGLWEWLNPFDGWDEAAKTGHDIGEKINKQGTDLIGKIPLIGDPLNKAGDAGQRSFESVLAYSRWLYDNGISQPLSTVILMGNRAQEDNKLDPLGSQQWKRIFSGAQWAQSWHAAEHISPGQALLLRGATTEADGQIRGGWAGPAQGPGALGPAATAQNIQNAAPWYGVPDKSLLPQNWDSIPEAEQQRMLRDAGVPISGNAAVERVRQQSPFFRYGSGAADFGLNWYADPLIVAGKAVGAARRAAYVTPIKLDWGSQEIQTLLNSSRVRKTADWIWENRDNPQLINSLDMVDKGGNAIQGRFGGMVSRLKSREELDDLLRMGWGDEAAKARLEASNVELAARIKQVDGRLPALNLAYSRVTAHGNERAMAMVSARIKELEAGINADVATVRRYNEMLAHFGEMDAVNLSRWSIAKAEKRSAARVGYQAGRARRSTATGRATGALPLGGLPKTQILRDYFGTPVTVIRSFGNYKPNGWMPLDDITKEAVTEIRGQIARIPGIGDVSRTHLFNQYLKTTSAAERRAYLEELDRITVEQIGRRYGFDAEDAKALMAEHQRRKALELGRLRDSTDEATPRYSTAEKPHPYLPGVTIKADNFPTEGGALHVSPNLRTKLQNHHALVDADEWIKVFSRHAPAIRALRDAQKEISGFRGSVGAAKDWVDDAADMLNTVWKFGTLFRLGYIPRTIGDDIAGQFAALGSVAMAMRTGYGIKNSLTNYAHRSLRGIDHATIAIRSEGVKYIDQELDLARADLAKVQGQVDNRVVAAERRMLRAEQVLQRKQNLLDGLSSRARAHTRELARNEVLKWERELRQAQRSHSQLTRVGRPLTRNHYRALDLERRVGHLERERTRALNEIEALKARQVENIRPWEGSPNDRNIKYQGSEGWTQDGMKIPGAFEGERGDFYLKSISSDESMARLFQSNKDAIHGNLMRSFDHGGVEVDAVQNEAVHARAWRHAINAQIMQDEFGRKAVEALEKYGPAGEAEAVPELAKWFRTAEGSKYWEDMGLAHADPEDFATSAWVEVNKYMPHPDIIAKAKEIDGVDEAFLRQVIEVPEMRPSVHTGQLNEVFGDRVQRRALDRVMDKWYHLAATVPANRLSRHPLFNQLYEGHAKRLLARIKNQGGPLTQERIDTQVAETARRLARKDMQKLVFDMAHKSDAVSAMRFISPFMGATTESWQRWARIIADKPQTVGYAAKFFNAPMAVGHMVDKDGHVLDDQGYVKDPVTGERRLVNKTDRMILVRLPKWIANGPIGVALGADTSGKWLLSQDSMNLVLTGDPWFNPGMGPMVQIPVSAFVKDKPDVAEVARHLGVLPYGPEPGGPVKQITAGLLPRTVQDFLTTWDTSDERYQSVRLHMLQQHAYEAENMGKPMPSMKQIDAEVRRYWLFSAASAFLRPVATTKQDPYQFYRDQYNELLRKHGDPRAADQEFLTRFGESYLVFAQSQTQNVSGVQATKKAAKLYEQYRGLIDEAPEMANLIIGPEGNGPFSPEAYAYQLNSPITTGSSEMQRRRLSADEAMKENKVRAGWADYTALVNRLNAISVGRGGRTFEDFDDLSALRKAYVFAWTTPEGIDGSANPYYKAEWAKDWTTLQPKKYEQLMPQLRAVAFSPLANNRNRSDLRALQQYLNNRDIVTTLLAQRKAAGGSNSLSAKSNEDLRLRWVGFVGNLIEQDLGFGDLHSRYLSRDMEVSEEELGQ